jgi:hypothetical protein
MAVVLELALAFAQDAADPRAPAHEAGVLCQQPRFFCFLRITHSDKVEPLEFLEFFVKGARLLWARTDRLQQLHSLLRLLCVFSHLGSVLFAQT